MVFSENSYFWHYVEWWRLFVNLLYLAALSSPSVCDKKLKFYWELFHKYCSNFFNVSLSPPSLSLTLSSTLVRRKKRKKIILRAIYSRKDFVDNLKNVTSYAVVEFFVTWNNKKILIMLQFMKFQVLNLFLVFLRVLRALVFL